MQRSVGILTIITALSAGSPAVADEAVSPFDEAAANAHKVRKLDRVVWVLTAACEQGDDLARRQCRILRDGAAARLRGATLAVDVPAGAIEIGGWDAAKKSTAITLRGCVGCAGIDVDGKPWVVVSNQAAPKVTGGRVEAAIVVETARTFPSEAAATTWKTEVAPRLRTQMIIKVPAAKATWAIDGAQGIAVEIAGYRVFDACDGTIVASSPESGIAPADRQSCGAVAEVKVGPAVPAEKVVAELSKAQILAGLKPAVEEAKACLETFGIAGDAKVKLTIGADGTVIAQDQSGDFVGSPTGACIDAAIQQATFPRSKKAKTTISYPIVLR